MTLAAKSKDSSLSHWGGGSPSYILHSVPSILCTAANATPHDRLFSFTRKSSLGVSLPIWFLITQPVLWQRNARR
ncbi:uncharacterized protein DEA37_0013394 [Paragonimus westermani]|uniref:Uncharacterized protein n=1 Tax=Paragonimus westermani TaxID=34504 RepID=A0A5J4N6Y6_9TREM|nr:uncharacterized protein DEA37_0013394 [Paragonimus westermani]